MSNAARSGVEIGRELNNIIEKKSQLAFYELILLGMLAGIYIGFGAIAATTVWANSAGMSVALSKFLGASVFCVGLVLVIIPGSELFTGNILMAAGVADRKVKLARVLRNWVCVYAGNFIGALLLAFAMFGTGLLGSPDAPSTLGEKAAAIAVAKIDLGFLQALLRGVLCNILVCLAVVLAISSHTIVGKILGIYFPIMVFVLSGFEHSVANMYFIPAGLLVKGSLFASFGLIWQNLVPVTIGNIIGGLLVIMLHPARVKQIARAIRE